MSLWLVSVPLEDSSHQRTWSILQDACGDGLLYRFGIPELKVGTLDSLLALSDETARHSAFVEGVVGKIRRQRDELASSGTNKQKLAEEDEKIFTRFVWEEAKYPVKQPLRETVERICEAVAHMDDGLKIRTQELTGLKSSLAALRRRETGSLLVRDLSRVVREAGVEIVKSQNMVSLFVVVPRSSKMDFEEQYETLTQFVVPRSAQKVTEDNDYTLYRVVIFRRVMESFKTAARDKGYQIRDVEDVDAEVAEARAGEADQMAMVQSSKKQAMAEWCKTSLGEAQSCHAHLCAVRIFVESILRYGLPPQFLSVAIKPPSRASAETKLRDTLRKTFAPLTQGSAHYHDGLDDHKDDAALLGILGSSGASGDGDKYPYYSLTITLS